MNSDEYIHHLEMQLKNSEKNHLKFYLTYLYSKINNQFSSTAQLLEIGSGAGLSKFFLPQNVKRTDVLPWHQNEVIGHVNALTLPYNSNQFDGAFCVDVVHHLNDPLKAIEELIRVVKPGSKVVVIEPLVTFLSYPVYKIFHSEKTSWNLSFSDSGNSLSSTPSDGDQGVSKSLFLDKKQNLHAVRRLTPICKWRVELFSPLSFFATGGLSEPLPTPVWLVRTILKLESLLPKFILKITASRILIVLEKY
jgi:SAM-dependent methyltransferase